MKIQNMQFSMIFYWSFNLSDVKGGAFWEQGDLKKHPLGASWDQHDLMLYQHAKRHLIPVV
jgi:hypothetical protein